MKAIYDTNIRRQPNGVIDSQYYLERSRSIRAKTFQAGLAGLKHWISQQAIRVIHQIDLIEERQKKCEQ